MVLVEGITDAMDVSCADLEARTPATTPPTDPARSNKATTASNMRCRRHHGV